MNQISGEHADKIYQAMHSCDGFLFRLQEFAESGELNDQAQGILLSDVAEMRSTISQSHSSPLENVFLRGQTSC